MGILQGWTVIIPNCPPPRQRKTTNICPSPSNRFFTIGSLSKKKVAEVLHKTRGFQLYKCSDRSGPPSQGLCLKLQATDLDCEFLKSKSIFSNLILCILHPCAGSPEQGKHVAASSGARWRPEALCFKLAMNIGLTMRGCDQSPSLRLKT